MTRRTLVAMALPLAAASCGGSAITEARVEHAVTVAFSNLVHAQLKRMSLPDVPAEALRVAASCYRVAGGSAGAGDWACTVIWSRLSGTPLRDAYDVTVGANGCYTATLGAAEAQLGGPIVTAADGRPVRNLLYAFDGCFDPF